MIKLKLVLLTLVVFVSLVSPAQASSGMTANELKAEILRLTKVADMIRAKLVKYGLPTPQTDNNSCLQTNLQMKRNDSGTSITRLQQFLVISGVYNPNLVTGYFGPATEAGVQRWQTTHGVVSYGTPVTTGFGRVGPSTLRAMHSGCAGGVYTGFSGTLNKKNTSRKSTKKVPSIQIEKYSLSVNPSKGQAPLAVTASFKIFGTTCTSYSLDWGDGTSKILKDSKQNNSCLNYPINITRTHIYKSTGDYKIIFKNGKGPLSSIKTVNSIDVKVSRIF